MTPLYAKQLLDLVRYGSGHHASRISHLDIRRALQVTGDLDPRKDMRFYRRTPNYAERTINNRREQC